MSEHAQGLRNRHAAQLRLRNLARDTVREAGAPHRGQGGGGARDFSSALLTVQTQ